MKQDEITQALGLTTVAPHAGAWIETEVSMAGNGAMYGRPPRGGVD